MPSSFGMFDVKARKMGEKGWKLFLVKIWLEISTTSYTIYKKRFNICVSREAIFDSLKSSRKVFLFFSKQLFKIFVS